MPRSSGRGVEVIASPRLNSGLLDDPVGGNSSGGAPEGGKRIGEWSQGVCGDLTTGTRTLLFALRTPLFLPKTPCCCRLRILLLPLLLRRAGGGASDREPPRAHRRHRHLQHVPLSLDARDRQHEGRLDVRGGGERLVLLRLLPLHLHLEQPRRLRPEAQARRRMLRELCVRAFLLCVRWLCA